MRQTQLQFKMKSVNYLQYNWRPYNHVSTSPEKINEVFEKFHKKPDRNILKIFQEALEDYHLIDNSNPKYNLFSLLKLQAGF